MNATIKIILYLTANSSFFAANHFQKLVYGVMNKRVAEFLEFIGKALVFLADDGQQWIALKPACEALNVEHTYFQDVKNRFYYWSTVCCTANGRADGKHRRMVSLPEKWVYAWFTSIQSSAPELSNYKK